MPALWEGQQVRRPWALAAWGPNARYVYSRLCLVPKKFCKIFQIPSHIESLDACIEY